MEAARLARPLKDEESLDCEGISGSGFSISKGTKEEIEWMGLQRGEGLSVRRSLKDPERVGVGTRTPGAQVCVMPCSAYCFPSWWLGLCP